MSELQELDKGLKNSIDLFTRNLVNLGEKALVEDNMLLQTMLLRQAALSILIKEEETMLKDMRKIKEEKKLIDILKKEINSFNQIVEDENFKLVKEQ